MDTDAIGPAADLPPHGMHFAGAIQIAFDAG
jgi:hypothetical protein